MVEIAFFGADVITPLYVAYGAVMFKICQPVLVTLCQKQKKRIEPNWNKYRGGLAKQARQLNAASFQGKAVALIEETALR